MTSAQFGSRVCRAFVAAMSAVAMMWSLAACGSNDANTNNEAASSPGVVALFTPSETPAITTHTPLNRWTKLAADINDALITAKFNKDDIQRFTSDSLEQQSQDVQDYVVNELSATASAKSSTSDSVSSATPRTIVVVPYAESSDAELAYGDYLGHEIDASGTYASRLVTALKLAQDSGIHVVLVGNSIEGFAPDAYVKCIDAESIGAVQAKAIVTKLDLDNVKADDPKNIEVLIPYSGINDRSGQDAQFAKELFSGFWKVMGAYFQSGVAVSHSGTLTSATKADGWNAVSYDPEKTTVADVLKTRLGKTTTKDADTDADTTDSADSSKDSASKDTAVRIDAVVAMQDAVASDVIKALGSLGYSGTAASTNPQISISGILDTFTGKKDLDREGIPNPSKTEAQDGEPATTKSSVLTHWPVITGYGAYSSNMPSIVQGKQWMTGLENRIGIAADVADACNRLNRNEGFDTMESAGTSTVAGVENVTTISLEPMAVSASNLKTTLIDPGYISLADAGM